MFSLAKAAAVILGLLFVISTAWGQSQECGMNDWVDNTGNGWVEVPANPPEEPPDQPPEEPPDWPEPDTYVGFTDGEATSLVANIPGYGSTMLTMEKAAVSNGTTSKTIHTNYGDTLTIRFQGGNLVQVSSANHLVQLAYDASGNIVGKNELENGVWSYSMYVYNSKHQVINVYYPSLQPISIRRESGSVEVVSGEPWNLVGMSDCGGMDWGISQGPDPSATMCNAGTQGQAAVCWDTWCTYKNISADQCYGGGNPGRVYQCNVSGAQSILLSVDTSDPCTEMFDVLDRLDETDLKLRVDMKNSAVMGLIGVGDALIPAGYYLFQYATKDSNGRPKSPVVTGIMMGSGLLAIGAGIWSINTAADIQVRGLVWSKTNRKLPDWWNSYFGCKQKMQTNYPACSIQPGGFSMGGGGVIYNGFGPSPNVSKWVREVQSSAPVPFNPANCLQYPDPDPRCTYADWLRNTLGYDPWASNG